MDHPIIGKLRLQEPKRPPPARHYAAGPFREVRWAARRVPAWPSRAAQASAPLSQAGAHGRGLARAVLAVRAVPAPRVTRARGGGPGAQLIVLPRPSRTLSARGLRCIPSRRREGPA